MFDSVLTTPLGFAYTEAILNLFIALLLFCDLYYLSWTSLTNSSSLFFLNQEHNFYTNKFLSPITKVASPKDKYVFNPSMPGDNKKVAHIFKQTC